MRLAPRWMALLVGLWAVAVAWLARETAGSGCPLGSCPACGACFRPPITGEAAKETRVG